MNTEWANIVTPVAAALLGVAVAGLVNYSFANKRERKQRRLEIEGAAVMLLAEVERIEYRLGMAMQEEVPERPKRDYNKAFYHSLLPRLGLLFQPYTISALVRFYQSVELLEALSDEYNRSGVNQDLNAANWKNEIQRANLTHRPILKDALSEDRPTSHTL